RRCRCRAAAWSVGDRTAALYWSASAATGRALILAVDAAEAVVAQREVERGIVGAATDVRAARRRPDVDDEHPRAGDDERYGGEHREPREQLTRGCPRDGSGRDDDRERERGTGDPRRQHLGVEGDA